MAYFLRNGILLSRDEVPSGLRAYLEDAFSLGLLTPLQGYGHGLSFVTMKGWGFWKEHSDSMARFDSLNTTSTGPIETTKPAERLHS